MPAPPTMEEQAEFLEYLIKTGKMADGRIAGDRWIRITKEHTEMLMSIHQRLERMAPHEARIRKLVTGK
jgi:hypothetical protein